MQSATRWRAPASTELRIVVDGNKLFTPGGKPVDADGDGQLGGIGTADFRTVPMTRIEGTNVSGRVIASERDEFGSDVPLEGVTIRVDGFPDFTAVTDADGQFTLFDTPAPEFFVHVDGSTVTSVGGQPVPANGFYPVVGKPFHSIPGETVQLEMDGQPFDIHLPFILNESIHDIAPGEEMTVGLPDAQTSADPELLMVQLTVPAGSLINDDGTPGTQVGIFRVESDRLPAPLPDGIEHSFDITVQADAPNFDVPAPISFPNMDGLAPGEKGILMSFDHGRGEWIPVGTMTVDASGEAFETDPGVGIRAPGWHGVQLGVITRGNLIVGQRGSLFGRFATNELSVQTGRHFYVIENLDNGFVIRGVTDVLDRIFDRVILSANASYRLSVFGLVSGQNGSVEFGCIRSDDADVTPHG